MKLVIVAPIGVLLLNGGRAMASILLASTGGGEEDPLVVQLSPLPSEVPTALPSQTLEATRPPSDRHSGSDQGETAPRMTPTPTLDLSGCNQHLPDDMAWHPGADPTPLWPGRGGLVTSPPGGGRLGRPTTVNVRLPQA